MGTVDVTGFNITDPINTDLTYVSPLAITTNTAQSGNTPAVNASYNGTGNNNLFDANVTFKAGGIINITVKTQVKAGVTGTKTNQGTGTDPASTKTDNIDNTSTGLPGGVVVPTASITQTQAVTIDPTAITISTGGSPNIILLKRITGVYRQNTPVVTNPTQLFSQFNNNSSDATDDPADWDINKFPAKDADGNTLVGDPPANPENNAYLRGAIDGGEVQSDDEIEFTIYFVNKGGANAANVTLCDLVPANLDFVQNAYGSGKGVAVSFDDENRDGTADNSKLYLEPNSLYSNANDTDKGTFFSKGTDTTATTPKCAFNAAQNKDGVVAIDLGTVPYATAQGDPTNSYGFIRFRAKVK
jgi:uncharacterized repeat protein (TIGR01451 family)